MTSLFLTKEVEQIADAFQQVGDPSLRTCGDNAVNTFRNDIVDGCKEEKTI